MYVGGSCQVSSVRAVQLHFKCISSDLSFPGHERTRGLISTL